MAIIPEDQLDSFIAAWKADFGEDIDRGFAAQRATEMLSLYRDVFMQQRTPEQQEYLDAMLRCETSRGGECQCESQGDIPDDPQSGRGFEGPPLPPENRPNPEAS